MDSIFLRTRSQLNICKTPEFFNLCRVIMPFQEIHFFIFFKGFDDKIDVSVLCGFVKKYPIPDGLVPQGTGCVVEADDIKFVDPEPFSEHLDKVFFFFLGEVIAKEKSNVDILGLFSRVVSDAAEKDCEINMKFFHKFILQGPV